MATQKQAIGAIARTGDGAAIVDGSGNRILSGAAFDDLAESVAAETWGHGQRDLSRLFESERPLDAPITEEHKGMVRDVLAKMLTEKPDASAQQLADRYRELEGVAAVEKLKTMADEFEGNKDHRSDPLKLEKALDSMGAAVGASPNFQGRPLSSNETIRQTQEAVLQEIAPLTGPDGSVVNALAASNILNSAYQEGRTHDVAALLGFAEDNNLVAGLRNHPDGGPAADALQQLLDGRAQGPSDAATAQALASFEAASVALAQQEFDKVSGELKGSLERTGAYSAEYNQATAEAYSQLAQEMPSDSKEGLFTVASAVAELDKTGAAAKAQDVLDGKDSQAAVEGGHSSGEVGRSEAGVGPGTSLDENSFAPPNALSERASAEELNAVTPEGFWKEVEDRGITPELVDSAVVELKEAAISEGRDPAQVDELVALESLVYREQFLEQNPDVAHSSELASEQSHSLSESLESSSRESSALEAPDVSAEMEMSMEGGGD